jgi:replication factor A1
LSENQELERVEVENLNPRSRRLDLTVKVVSKNPVRDIVSRRDGSSHRVTEALVGDATGSVLLTLWDDDIEKVNDDDVLNIKNGYVTLFRGSMRLNIGRFGTFEMSEEVIENVNTENNLSDKEYEQERRYGGYRRSYGGRGYSDRRSRRY